MRATGTAAGRSVAAAGRARRPGVMARSRARDRLAAAAEGRSTAEVCGEIVGAVGEVAEFGWSLAMTTDPTTMLPSGGVVHGFAHTDCEPYWDNELLDPDFIKFAELARRVDPVATLYDAVDGDLARSPRYVRLYASLGAADELRVAFTAGSSCHAVAAFVRPGPLGRFSADEVAAVRALVPAATKALTASLARRHAELARCSPVVLLLDPSGAVAARTRGADDVLGDLHVDIDAGDDVGDAVGDEGVPGVVQVAVLKARSAGGVSELTTRLRGRSGRWYRLHVAPMARRPELAAVTIEAARSDDIAQVLVDSFGLTRRETEIVQALCRGRSTREIAAELIISAHTVRDHIKAIYDKAGVGGRAELVAALFSDHVLDGLAAPAPSPPARVAVTAR